MRATRPTVSLGTSLVMVGFLSSCGGRSADDPCFQPRAADASECLFVDGGLTLSRTMPIEEATVRAMCEAPCVDVSGTLEIDGYDRLVDVPGLSKIRRLGGLAIHVKTLRDLKGLEHVDVTGGLYLINRSGESDSFMSLEGFSDDTLIGLTLNGLRAARFDLKTLGLRQLELLNLEYTDLVSVDATGWSLKSISVRGCDELLSINLGAAPMESVSLIGNEKLETLTWPEELSVKRNIYITNNTALSTCEISNFVSETTESAIGVVTENNGPCR